MTRVPQEGDIIEIDDDGATGHEQRGRRPALVVSVNAFQVSGLAIVCPLTTHGGRATRASADVEVAIPAGCSVGGVILSHQPKTVDWRARNASPVEHLPRAVLLQVRARLKAFLGV